MENAAKTKPQNRIDSLIGAGTVVEGSIRFALADCALTARSGQCRRYRRCDLVLVQERAGARRFRGRRAFVINGTVAGPESFQSLEMQPRARIVGDVEYMLIEMHQGR